jgi:subfamily B ATP-binding cassette protein MsbA
LEILDADVKIEEIAEPVSISTLKNNIEFKNIGFYYDKANLILKNFNLTIPKGKLLHWLDKVEVEKQPLPIF